MNIDDDSSPGRAFDELEAAADRTWSAVRAARREAASLLSRLTGLLSSGGFEPSADRDLVVFGSIARGECTDGSDVDWTLLVDGQASPCHQEVELLVRRAIAGADPAIRQPGTSGVFGHRCYSHDIINHIGGQQDTNRNTTQRVLLLLESRALHGGEAHRRVLREVVRRYVADDSAFYSAEGAQARVPRFLLNDIVRFWRTMCVDFACKAWEQGGKKWASRNIKLRLSRKLIFVSGLLLCFSCFENEALSTEFSDVEGMTEHLVQTSCRSPLERLAETAHVLGKQEEGIRILSAYDEFLAYFGRQREHLEDLRPDEAYQDAVFREGREISRRFQDGLTALFFDKDREARLGRFTCDYGLF